MKKLITFILALVVLAGQAFAIGPDDGINGKWGYFFDRPDGTRGYWAWLDINEEYRMTKTTKCINGFPDGSFRPEETVTYAQACTIIANLIEPEQRQNIRGVQTTIANYKAQEHWAKWAVWGTVGHCGYLYPASTITDTKETYGKEVTYINYDYKLTRKDVAYLIGMYCNQDTYVIPKSGFSDYQLDISKHTPEFGYADGRELPVYAHARGSGTAGLKKAYTWNCYEMACNLQYSGIIEGYPDGTFRPDQLVTRAEFITIVCRALKGCVYENTDTTVPTDCVGHWAEEYIAKCYIGG